MAMTKVEQMPIVLEKARLNLWNLGGFVFLAIGMAYGYGTAESNRQNDTKELRKEITSLQVQTSKLEAQAPNILQLQFQTTQLNKQAADNRAAIEEMNKRMDRIVESWGGKLDKVLTDVNKLTVAVEVLTSKVDAQPKRINLNMPTESNMFGYQNRN